MAKKKLMDEYPEAGHEMVFPAKKGNSKTKKKVVVKCGECGASLKKGEKSCPKCGAKC